MHDRRKNAETKTPKAKGKAKKLSAGSRFDEGRMPPLFSRCHLREKLGTKFRKILICEFLPLSCL
jgi:hypothetical protein